MIELETGRLIPVGMTRHLVSTIGTGIETSVTYRAESAHEPKAEIFKSRACAEFWLWCIAERVESRKRRLGA